MGPDPGDPMTETPWRGILTATALPFDADGAVDYARYADHVDWLVRNGPGGSDGHQWMATTITASSITPLRTTIRSRLAID